MLVFNYCNVDQMTGPPTILLDIIYMLCLLQRGDIRPSSTRIYQGSSSSVGATSYQVPRDQEEPSTCSRNLRRTQPSQRMYHHHQDYFVNLYDLYLFSFIIGYWNIRSRTIALSIFVLFLRVVASLPAVRILGRKVHLVCCWSCSCLEIQLYISITRKTGSFTSSRYSR